MKCAHKHAIKFSVPTRFQVHNQVWAPWNCDAIITIGINKHEVVEKLQFLGSLWPLLLRLRHF